MDLNDPCFDSVLAIDERLKALETEVSTMESKFSDRSATLPMPS